MWDRGMWGVIIIHTFVLISRLEIPTQHSIRPALQFQNSFYSVFLLLVFQLIIFNGKMGKEEIGERWVGGWLVFSGKQFSQSNPFHGKGNNLLHALTNTHTHSFTHPHTSLNTQQGQIYGNVYFGQFPVFKLS